MPVVRDVWCGFCGSNRNEWGWLCVMRWSMIDSMCRRYCDSRWYLLDDTMIIHSWWMMNDQWSMMNHHDGWWIPSVRRWFSLCVLCHYSIYWYRYCTVVISDPSFFVDGHTRWKWGSYRWQVRYRIIWVCQLVADDTVNTVTGTVV